MKFRSRPWKIKPEAPCDTVLVVLLDDRTLEPREMWEAPIEAVKERLLVPGSKARVNGVLGVREFKRLAQQVWPAPNATPGAVRALARRA